MSSSGSMSQVQALVSGNSKDSLDDSAVFDLQWTLQRPTRNRTRRHTAHREPLYTPIRVTHTHTNTATRCLLCHADGRWPSDPQQQRAAQDPRASPRTQARRDARAGHQQLAALSGTAPAGRTAPSAPRRVRRAAAARPTCRSIEPAGCAPPPAAASSWRRDRGVALSCHQHRRPAHARCRW